MHRHPDGTRAPLALAAGVAALAALVPLFPLYFQHWDEVQLRLAVERFDLVWHQPHPPGYYVFVLLARVAHALAPGSLEPGRLVAAGAAAAFAALVVLRLPRGLAPGARALLALAAVGVALCTSLVRFFAVSHLTYVPEGAAWLGILLLASRRPRGPALWACAGLVGLSGGLRQTLPIWSALLCAGLWLRDRSWIRPRDLAPAALAFAAGVAAWLVPMCVETGGLATWLEATRRISAGAIWTKSAFSAPGDLVGRVLLMLWHAASALFWIPVPFAVASVFERRAPAAAAGAAADGAGASAPPILLAGAAIAFAFYALLIYDSAGYAMSYVLPTAAFGILACGDLALRLGPRRGLLPCAALLAALLGVGTLFPLRDYSLAAMRDHDARLRERFEAVHARFDPATTLLVTSTERRRWSLRHVMYYLPEYTALQLLRDPCFLPVTPETPYLLAREHRLNVAGPEGLDVARLAPPGIERVVYMVPGPADRWIGESCAPFLEPFETSGGELLHALRVSPALEVAVRDQRLECRAGLAAAPPAEGSTAAPGGLAARRP